MNDRERRIVKHILRHCEEAMRTVKRFDSSIENFERDHVFYNACAMSLFQIGELSKRMSEDFKKNHTQIPWSEMRGMRNLFAHEYESVDKKLLWETLTKDIPVLYEQLQKIYLCDISEKNEMHRPSIRPDGDI
jgi:hypothetical protein